MSLEAQVSDNALLDAFIEESIDALVNVPKDLEEFHRDPQNIEPINAVFRAVHTIKGNAGFFDLKAVKDFAHSVENTLSDLRDGKISFGEELLRVIVDSIDLLEEMLHEVGDGVLRKKLNNRESDVLAEIKEHAGERLTQSENEHDLLRSVLQTLADDIAKSGVAQAGQWATCLRQFIDNEQPNNSSEEDKPSTGSQLALPQELLDVPFFLNGEDISLRVAPLLNIFAVVERNELTDEAAKTFVDSAIHFAEWLDGHGNSTLANVVKTAIDDFLTIHGSPLTVDSTLMSIVWVGLGPLLCELAVRKDEQKEADNTQNQPSESDTTSSASDKSTATETSRGRVLRVNERRLDEFSESVANLFMTCEGFKNVMPPGSGNEMTGLTEQLRQLNTMLSAQVHDLHQSVMELRKIPMRGLLSKFPRMARSLASQLDKKISVHIEGEEVEVDKSLFEDLDGPLTHIVRNVVDHAIELPEERRRRGVEEVGNLWLKAELRNSLLLITARDDGRGIDPDKLRDKAVSKQLQTRSQVDALSDREAVNLIFLPGFSTAEKLTDISGRGVGLDVVRTTLHKHNGEIRLQSEVGIGSTFCLEIPVREAVLVVDTLLVQQGTEKFALPLSDVVEIREIDDSMITMVHNQPVVNFRGTPIAAVSIGDLLDVEQTESAEDFKILGVVISCKSGSMCLYVDKIIGQRKVVVQSLKKTLSNVDVIAGAAQLGGGRLALIPNVAELVKSLGNLANIPPNDCG